MQDMSYYTESGVNFPEIQKCAQSLGYLSQQYDWYGLHLNVFFQSGDDLVSDDAYCRWNEGIKPDDAKKEKIFRQLAWKPEVGFWIQYRIAYLPQLVVLLKCVLEKYGGCVDTSLSFKLFTLNNISDLLSVSLSD